MRGSRARRGDMGSDELAANRATPPVMLEAASRAPDRGLAIRPTMPTINKATINEGGGGPSAERAYLEKVP